ncbi:MAG: thiolase family protein [Candidatus Nitrohelix vancouverensis]|uniref:Thiolase family protein n=1 Tax=Candidatus Nitrohelix vancouverensis TaxID=2705534 RepID=A0A7T0G2H2_9BACT|nr:MAG: thiolase family protein [Candidatus Nitrohelix vancouverensis]
MKYAEHSYIYSAVRTPIGAFNGALSSVSAPDLAAVAITEALKRSAVSLDAIGSVYLGNVLPAGLGQAPARQAARKSGLPDHVGGFSVNKVCGSGLQCVILADQSVRLGQADFVVAGGMENMSRAPFLIPQMRRGHKLGNASMIDSMIHDGLWDSFEEKHMGQLSDALGQQLAYSRESQDAYALNSYARARRAQESGIFAREIACVSFTKKGVQTVIDKDEQPFADDLDDFASLSPVFDRERGSITKGNGAKLNDGAAAMVIGKETADLKPIARIIAHTTHAQSPATFALAPVEAIRKILKANQLSVNDIDLFEINEAFAVMSLAVNEQLGLNPEKVNVHGGSIALGHPIGATGARILVTLINALQERNLKRGLASLCIGGGEALAMIIERV